MVAPVALVEVLVEEPGQAQALAVAVGLVQVMDQVLAHTAEQKAVAVVQAMMQAVHRLHLSVGLDTFIEEALVSLRRRKRKITILARAYTSQPCILKQT
jgi:anaerobic C4-dicarboxylate transporter